MTRHNHYSYKIIFGAIGVVLLFGFFNPANLLCRSSHSIEEITFQSGPFKVVGDLKLPEGKGPHPVVVFVHGDGPNNRDSGGSYPPIMERTLKVGYAVFSWDKPGTGESTGEFKRDKLFKERAQIVIDAIGVLKEHPSSEQETIIFA